MTKIAVITGIGVVLPGAQSLDDLWRYQIGTDNLIKPLSDRICGTTVDEAQIAHRLSPRLSNKVDAFTRFALVATENALTDAALQLDTINRERCGVYVGNAFGGWRFTEVELRKLHVQGPRSVSPFQATSWFPAAPQGQISITHGIKGCSKTLMADRASSLLSVAAAAQKIQSGTLDVAIAGGAESTNTPFVRTALEQLLGPDGNQDSFAPHSGGRDGFAISEGAVFLILEEREFAIKRGARIYAQIGQYAMGNAPCESDRYASDAQAWMNAISAASSQGRPDVVLPDACGIRPADHAEAAAIRELCSRAPLLMPKSKFGHGFGMEGALDLAYASLILHKQQLLPSQAKEFAAPLHADQLVHRARDQDIRTVMVNAGAIGGGVNSFILHREEF